MYNSLQNNLFQNNLFQNLIKIVIDENKFAFNVMIFLITAILLYQLSGIGITAGAHRLWAHRSYKAKWPLQLLLMILNTIAFQVRNQVFVEKLKERDLIKLLAKSKIYRII